MLLLSKDSTNGLVKKTRSCVLQNFINGNLAEIVTLPNPKSSLPQLPWYKSNPRSLSDN